ncbi:unnamed protein product [Ceutorhynchus assimilis]|uniref:Bee-milk protein n=1 Tax=Ceutorhynchus assimilis TaxID=467358 RepID=A0A9N9QSM1_9CUCU|nr:unnamed protein product [Ceutorhynchus assimilis]
MFLKLVLLNAFVVVYVKASLCDCIEWTGQSLQFPNQKEKLLCQTNGSYISKNGLMTRGQIYENHLYGAMPRFKPGVAATLVKVSLKSKACEASLVPFPNWEAQNEDNCEGLQSIMDIFLDPHGFLWCLDSGVVLTHTDNPIRKCPPKVVIFDLKTGKKVKTVHLSGLVVKCSRLQYLVVDYNANGKPILLISDASLCSILVFDVAEGKGYRLVLPKAVANCKRDVLYLCLMQKTSGSKFLIVTYLSGSRVFSINLEDIRRGSAAGNIQDLGPKERKIVPVSTDGATRLFYRHEGESDIYKWDADSELFCEGNLVYKEDNCCYLATQVMPYYAENRMMLLESNFHDYIQGTVGCGTSQRVCPMVSYV